MLGRLFLVLTGFYGLLLAAPALACDCYTGPVEPEKYLREATLVFEGEVLSTPLSSGFLDTVTIRVLSPMKGRLGDVVVLDQSAAGDCVALFGAGERVRIVAYGGNAEGGYHTSACLLWHLGGATRARKSGHWPRRTASTRWRWVVRICQRPTRPRCDD
jgi:hypothetical protein